MSLWGSKDQANNAPKYKILATSPNTGSDLFNTSVVGLDNSEVVDGHAGWNRVTYGTGPVLSVDVTNGGTLYANTDTVTVSGGTSNASGTVAVDANGTITSVVLTNGGSGFKKPADAIVTVTTSTGANATFTVTLGGRAGRIQTETLVAMGSMTGNGSAISG